MAFAVRILITGVVSAALAATAPAQEAPRPIGGTSIAVEPLVLPYNSAAGPDRVLVVLLANDLRLGRGYGLLPQMLLGQGSMSLANYLEAASFGQESIGAIDIYGIYPTRFDTLSGPYDGAAILADAMAALEHDAVLPDWDSYRFILVVVDDIRDPFDGEDRDGDGFADLPNGGLPVHHRVDGELKVPGAVLGGFLTDSPREFVQAVAHELGHTVLFGLPHSGSLDCEGAQGDYFACRRGSSNGDRTDVMGNGGYFPGDRPRHPSAWFKRTTGWLPLANVRNGGAGVFELFPLERDLGAGHLQLIAIRLDEKPPFDAAPYRDSLLTVEYRVSEGYDDGLAPGIYIKLMGASQLWNLTETPLGEGDAFIDEHNGIRVEALTIYGDSAAVSVERF